MRLSAHNISIDLPQGWDGRIFARPAEPGDRQLARGDEYSSSLAATLHTANFALPGKDGDFGTVATATMPAPGIFLSLTEYMQGNGLRAGSGLFASRRVPSDLRAEMFSPNSLLLARPGQAGLQRFFAREYRPFCLYIVVGSYPGIGKPLQLLNRVLSSVRIDAVGHQSPTTPQDWP